MEDICFWKLVYLFRLVFLRIIVFVFWSCWVRKVFCSGNEFVSVCDFVVVGILFCVLILFFRIIGILCSGLWDCLVFNLVFSFLVIVNVLGFVIMIECSVGLFWLIVLILFKYVWVNVLME